MARHAPFHARFAAELTAWMLTASGMALIAAAVLLPAQARLDAVLAERERVLEEEVFRRDRLENYLAYLDALDTGDERLFADLAQREFGTVPEGMRTLDLDAMPISRGAWTDPFGSLEPVLESSRSRTTVQPPSLLERWVVRTDAGRWVIVVGALLLFAGTLWGRPTQRRAG